MRRARNVGESSSDTTVQIALAYAHGRIEVECERLASSVGISSGEFTRRLGELLVGASYREVLGPLDNLSRVPLTSRTRRPSVESVEVARGTSERARLTKLEKLQAYWTPERRAAQGRRIKRYMRQNPKLFARKAK